MYDRQNSNTTLKLVLFNVLTFQFNSPTSFQLKQCSTLLCTFSLCFVKSSCHVAGKPSEDVPEVPVAGKAVICIVRITLMSFMVMK